MYRLSSSASNLMSSLLMNESKMSSRLLRVNFTVKYRYLFNHNDGEFAFHSSSYPEVSFMRFFHIASSIKICMIPLLLSTISFGDKSRPFTYSESLTSVRTCFQLSLSVSNTGFRLSFSQSSQ